MIDLVPDLLLCLMLLILAAGALFSPSLLGGSTAFILFGVILALVWVRLQSPDLAIAEAAIGAGLTGILLLTAVARGQPQSREKISRLTALAAVAVLVLIAGIFISSMSQEVSTSSMPQQLAQSHISESGVTHPVTAVLLNFRGWDTLLELAVLLLALLGVRQLNPLHPPAATTPWPLLLAWSKTLAPLLLLVGGYLLWRGSSRPGGAFQAGALIAAGAALLRLGGILPPLPWHRWGTRAVALLSLVAFLALAVATAWLGDGWLDYPSEYGVLTSGRLILAIELCATISIALLLTLLVVGDDKDLKS